MRCVSIVFLVIVVSSVFAQEHFIPVELGEDNGNLCRIQQAELDEVMLVEGDEIGIFDRNGFDQNLCVGAGVVDGNWPLDIVTTASVDGLPGYVMNNPIFYKIWSHEEDVEYIADGAYTAGSGIFDENLFHEIQLTSFTMFARQWIMPGEGSTTVQLNMVPDIADAGSVFQTMEYLMMVLAPNGGVYLPNAMNSIGNLDFSSSYQVNHSNSDVLTVWGSPILDPEIEVQLEGEYFELVSSYMQPLDLDVENVFGGIESLMIVYENDGEVYVPFVNPPLNRIGNINITEAYYLFCSEDSEWRITGNYIDPETEYTLYAHRWNWLGYPFGHPVNAEIALQEISDQIIIVQADDGRFWAPGIQPVNFLGNLLAGEGYMIMVEEDLTFTYEESPLLAGTAVIDNNILPFAEDAPEPSGLPYTILVRMTGNLLSLNPSSIEVYDGDLLVGKSLVLKDHPCTPVTAWKGSQEYNLSGFKSGNTATIRVLSSDGSILASDQSVCLGSNAYADITLDNDNFAVPGNFNVSAAYPNPFNPSITVPFTLPEDGKVMIALYNMLGQQIYSDVKFYNAGSSEFYFNTGMIGTEIVSGIYFLKISNLEQNSIQKIVLLK